jgi:hypothetical protein
VAIVRRSHRAGSRIGLPALDARPCLIGGFAEQLKRAPAGEPPRRSKGLSLRVAREHVFDYALGGNRHVA